jgi:hypothetical protein
MEDVHLLKHIDNEEQHINNRDQPTLTNMNHINHVNHKRKIKIKWDYVVILLILIACLILDILLLMYLNSIINEIYDYKDKLEAKINDEDLEDYLDKFKKVMDYFCDKMIEC